MIRFILLVLFLFSFQSSGVKAAEYIMLLF